MGSVDRLIRLIVGIVVIALGIIYKNWWGAIGIVFVATALIRFCPLYVPLGISTNKGKDN